MQQLQIEFVSTVPNDCREAVEALFFFNPRQRWLREGIRTSIERFGLPEIVQENGRLWIGSISGTTQCLFALDRGVNPQRLAGVVLYGRIEPDVMVITHLAVDPDYASGGGQFADGMGVLLIEKVREIARRINGVQRIELPYRPGCFLPVTPRCPAARLAL